MSGLGSADWLTQIMATIVVSVLQFALGQMQALVRAFGTDTEPDFSSVVGVYQVMFAIGLLLAGAIIASALLERMAGGSAGAGWNVLARTMTAVFFACFGIQLVEYLAHYADLMTQTLTEPTSATTSVTLASLGMDTPSRAEKFLTDNLGSLFLIGIASGVLSFVVYLELIVRGALILVVTAFIPLVAVMAIWPRLVGAATHLAEFLVGLILSKFVLATAITIGFGLVARGMFVTGAHNKTSALLTGIAVLLIAAFSPLVLVQGLRLTHNTAGSVARGWIAAGASAIPLAAAMRLGGVVIKSSGLPSVGSRVTGAVRSRLPGRSVKP